MFQMEALMFAIDALDVSNGGIHAQAGHGPRKWMAVSA
jgi:hypothetical protein